MTDSNPYESTEHPAPEYDGEVSPSSLLIRSFLVLIASVAVYFILGLGAHAAVILLAFPEEAKAMSQSRERDPETADESTTNSNESNEANANSDSTDAQVTDESSEGQADGATTDDPKADSKDALTPSPLFWGIGILIYLIAAFASGCLIGKLAPMATMGHGVFLAAILFLSSLQAKEMEVFDRPAWALAAYAFGVPLTVMFGTYLMLPRELSDEAIEQELSEDEAP